MARMKKIAIASFRPEPAWSAMIPESSSSATAISEWGPTPNGRPTAQAASSAAPSQPMLISTERVSRPIVRIPNAFSSSELAGKNQDQVAGCDEAVVEGRTAGRSGPRTARGTRGCRSRPSRGRGSAGWGPTSAPRAGPTRQARRRSLPGRPAAPAESRRGSARAGRPRPAARRRRPPRAGRRGSGRAGRSCRALRDPDQQRDREQQIDDPGRRPRPSRQEPGANPVGADRRAAERDRELEHSRADRRGRSTPAPRAHRVRVPGHRRAL